MSSLSAKASAALDAKKYDVAAELYARDGAESNDSNSYYNAGLALSQKMYPAFNARSVSDDNPEYLKIIDYYEKAIELSHNTHGRAFINLGKVYEFMGAFDRAIPLLTRALSLPRNSSDWLNACLSLGSIYMAQEQVKEAVEVFEGAIKEGHSSEPLHNKLAACYYFQNEFINATEQYEMVLQCNPNNNDARDKINTIAPDKARQERKLNAASQSTAVAGAVNDAVARGEERVAKTQAVMADYQAELAGITARNLPPTEIGGAYMAAADNMQKALQAIAEEYD